MILTCCDLTPAKIFSRNILGTAKTHHSISVASSTCKSLSGDAFCPTQISHHCSQPAPGSVHPLDHQSRQDLGLCRALWLCPLGSTWGSLSAPPGDSGNQCMGRTFKWHLRMTLGAPVVPFDISLWQEAVHLHHIHSMGVVPATSQQPFPLENKGQHSSHSSHSSHRTRAQSTASPPEDLTGQLTELAFEELHTPP